MKDGVGERFLRSSVVEHLTDKTAATLLVTVLLLWPASAVNQTLFDQRVAEVAKSAHRLPDVRQIDETTRAPFIKAYLRHLGSTDSRPGVVVLGDSQFFGFGCVEHDVFTQHLAERFASRFPVVNLSVVDARLKDIAAIVEALKASPLRVGQIVWGVGLHHLGDAYNNDVRRVPDATWFRVSAFDPLRLDPMRSVSAADAAFYVNPGRQRNLYSNLDVRKTELLDVFEGLKRLGVPGLVVMPPVCLEEFPRYGYDRTTFDAVRRELREVATRYEFQFLDLTGAFAKPDFLDFMHLRPSGHAKLAQSIALHLR